ncbi:MAG: alpha/beta hydrolase fold domain-containing protein [Woeseia sp.]|nr:alpha/beta hydrolase fold domain-containing protein [Woeseia sp.]
MQVALLETVESTAEEDVEGSVIWLHGLGADGHDFEPIVPELRLEGELKLRFIFPHAPLRKVTINGGMEMRAWYDILSLERDGPQDEAGIRDSGAQLEALIAREQQRGVALNKIVLAGFSQGGAIAMHTALRQKERLAGLMALSTWLPLHDAFDREVTDAPDSQSRDLPVFVAHGTFDPMLPLALGEDARDSLKGAGFAPEWHSYPMAHSVCAEEIAAIREWLLRIYGVSRAS